MTGIPFPMNARLKGARSDRVAPARMPLLALTLAAACLANPAQAGCPALPAPAGVLTTVAADTEFNGLMLTALQLETKLSPAAVLAFYRNEFAKVHGSVEYPVGAWAAIASGRGPCFYSIQVKEVAGGAVALVGISTPGIRASGRKPGGDFPVIAGGEIVSDLVHNDPGKPARTLMLSAQGSIGRAAAFYEDALARNGWARESTAPPRAPGGGAASGVVQTWKRNGALLSLVITGQSAGTMVLAQIAERP